MHAVPDPVQVREFAATLGMTLSAGEAELYTERLAAHLVELDEFVQNRWEETAPPRFPGAREPGYKPSAEEDPHNAWLWKCAIAGAPDGLLAGKTVSFKDHTAVAGVPLTFGSFPFEGFIPDFDATVVSRVLEQGATVTGKNVMNGLTGGFGFGGGIGDYGRPLNPHNPDHVTGGSSSGSAVALALNEVDISFGGDQGGSIRIPAAWSGTVGHKPTFGLVSHFGIGFGSEQSIDYTGPMARNVEDTAAALQAVSGYDGLDPRQTRPVPDSIDVLSTLTNGVKGLRIGILEEGFIDAEVDVADMVNAAADVLAEAGAIISKVSVPAHLMARTAQQAMGPEGSRAVFETGFFGAFAKTYYPSSLIAAVNKVWADETDLLNPRSRLQYLVAEYSRRNFHGRVYAKSHNVRAGIVAAYDAALAEVDLLIMPTCIIKAPKFEKPATEVDALKEALGFAGVNKGVLNTQPFNYSGHPALAMPVGKSGGLPVSMQLVGKFFDDATVLRAAYTYQHSVPFAEYIAVER